MNAMKKHTSPARLLSLLTALALLVSLCVVPASAAEEAPAPAASFTNTSGDGGADAVSLINTLLGMRIDLRTKQPVIANVMGGFSGPAVFPVALRMVYQVYEAVSVPIMGLGGVSSADDVIEMMLAGATAVQVGTANLKNPWACKEILEDLPSRMEAWGISSLQEIIGGAHQ